MKGDMVPGGLAGRQWFIFSGWDLALLLSLVFNIGIGVAKIEDGTYGPLNVAALVVAPLVSLLLVASRRLRFKSVDLDGPRIDKGGHNVPPTTPRPTSVPGSQGPRP